MTYEQEAVSNSDRLVRKWIRGYRRGSLRFFILHLLLDRHRSENSIHTNDHHRVTFHGYHLAQSINEITEGKWQPKTASIYPILKELKDSGIIEKVPDDELIDSETKRHSKKYRLTHFGEDVATKLEMARMEFTRAFHEMQSKFPLKPLLMVKKHHGDEELRKFIENIEIPILKGYQDRIIEHIASLNEILHLIEKMIEVRSESE